MKHEFTGRIVILSILLALGAGLACPPQKALAAGNTITVTTLSDASAADGFCSLREAIDAAEFDMAQNECPAGSGDDTVLFAVDGTIVLESNLPYISQTMTIDGSGRNVILSGNNTYRGLVVDGNLTLKNLTIQNTTTSLWGAAIFNSGTLLVMNSTLRDNYVNSSGYGAGIMNYDGTITIINSTLSGNSAGFGGALYNNNATTLNVLGSTISNNQSTSSSGGGGGIMANGTVVISNSTFSGNSAVNSSGAISNWGNMTLTYNTFAGNSAGSGGKDIGNITGTVSMAANLLASSGSDCGGNAVIDNGYNMSSDASCGFSATGSQNNATLNLGSLADNGGPTLTILPGTGSAARDAIPPDTTITNNTVSFSCNQNGETLDADQRGAARPQGSGCDVGAFEYGVESYTLTITSDHGMVIKSPNYARYLDGSVVQITSVPDFGWNFAYWGDDLTGTDNPAPVTINGDTSVTAYYAPNQPPSDISLSNTSIAENQPVGTTVGTLAAVDQDTGDTHTYSLACSTPGADDVSFSIVGGALNTAAVFDYETRNTYNICIHTNDGNGGTFDKNFNIYVTDVVETIATTFRSAGAQDGWILETGEKTDKGGTLDSASTTLRLGDDSAKKQYRSILSFATGATLPDNAIITKVTLKVRKQGITGGGNPVTTFQGFMVDIKKGLFGTSVLQAADFQTAASKTYGPFNTALSGGWYTINLTAGKAYINKLGTGGGLTQIRLRFSLDDNNNTVANYLSLYSGDAGASTRPQLIVEYNVP